MSQYSYDWSELAFASKREIKAIKACFIAAPREMSDRRFIQLVKELLPQANIIIGIAKEDYVEGFEGQPQFAMLKLRDIQNVIDKVNSSSSKHKIYTLHYFQRELVPILEKIKPRQTLFVNGSWKYTFHNTVVFYHLVSKGIPYRLVSAFVDEDEARAYAKIKQKKLLFSIDKTKTYTPKDLLALCDEVAKLSYDYGYQTGVILAKKFGSKYKYVLSGHNKVVPFETYALHYGASREKHFSPPQDMNYYDTAHAEVELVLSALKSSITLQGHSLFINLLPCPSCARMLADSGLAELVYQIDHSDGYAVRLLELAGIKVTRIVA